MMVHDEVSAGLAVVDHFFLQAVSVLGSVGLSEMAALWVVQACRNPLDVDHCSRIRGEQWFAAMTTFITRHAWTWII